MNPILKNINTARSIIRDQVNGRGLRIIQPSDNIWASKPDDSLNGRYKNENVYFPKSAKVERNWLEYWPALPIMAAPMIALGGPAAIAAGDKLAATAGGRAVTSGLNFLQKAASNSKWFPWANAGATSVFAARGADKIRRGDIHNVGDVVETGLDLLPLTQLAKPVVSTAGRIGSTVKEGLNKTMTLYNSPLTGNWTKIGNREYRFKPGHLGMNGAPMESREATVIVQGLPIGENRYYRAFDEHALDSYRDLGVISQLNKNGFSNSRFDVPHFSKGAPLETRLQNPTSIWAVSKPNANLVWESKRGSGASYYYTPTVNGEYNAAPISEFDFYRALPNGKGYVKLTSDLNVPEGINLSSTPHIDYLNSLNERQQIEYLTNNGLNSQWLWTLKNNPDHLESALSKAPIPNISTPQITAENAASMTPAQWTAAQDAAIARGDMAEAQRLRDLHFQVSAPNTKTNVPLWSSSEEAFNSFDLSHFGETDSGFFGYGHYLTPIEKYAATYHPINRKFYANIENPYIGSNDRYFNRIQYVKDRLAMRKENVMRNLRDGKLTKFSKKLGINENTSLEDAERLVDKYIADETVKWNDKYVKYADEFEGKDGVLSWRELQGIPNKQDGIYREVVVPRGEQIKSAEAITFDDNGVRIPLGERDNFKLNDIRYGLLPFIGLGTLGTMYGTSNK